MKKKILIKCVTENFSNKICRVIVLENNKIIINELTDRYGNLTINLDVNKVYKINIIKNNICIREVVIIKPKLKCICSLVNNSHLITIKLTDKNYQGLKIERGNIILWQNHIK